MHIRQKQIPQNQKHLACIVNLPGFVYVSAFYAYILHISSVLYCFWFFETGSHYVALAGLELNR